MFKLLPPARLTRKGFSRRLLPVFFLLGLALSGSAASAQTVTLLDNTKYNGVVPKTLGTNGGAVSATSYTAYGLQVGATGYDLTGATFGLRSTTGGVFMITLDLYQADTNLKPVGAPIESEFDTFVLNGGSYQNFNLTGLGFRLAANNRYAIGLRTNGPQIGWVAGEPFGDHLPTGSAGITAAGAFQSTNSGGSWSSLSTLYRPAFSLRGVAVSSPPAAVPEPGAVALFLPALGAVLLLRRRGSASRENSNLQVASD